MFFSVAFAQAAAPRVGPSGLENVFPYIFGFLILYILLIRPQGKKHKQHQEFLAKMKKGDQVLTSGGILGTIEGLTEQYATLEVDSGVRLRVLKTQIASVPTVGKPGEGK